MNDQNKGTCDKSQMQSAISVKQEHVNFTWDKKNSMQPLESVALYVFHHADGKNRMPMMRIEHDEAIA